MKEDTKLVGCLAKSLAGHDKGKHYLVINEQKQDLYLVDGEIRSINYPKKKNKKHVQVIYFTSEDVKKRLCDGNLQDIHVKRIIKEYIQNRMHQQEC